MHYTQLISKIQVLTFWKNPRFILALILSVFFLKGVFLATITPIFVGQDESRHYSSVQYLAEPRPITWPLIGKDLTEKEGFEVYNYSQEVQGTARAIEHDKVNDYLFSTYFFIQRYDGKNETEINNNNWHQYNEYASPNIAGKYLYHHLASGIEKIFGEQSILVRYFLVRIFSVFLGMLTILFSYLIAKNIGLSSKNSLLLTAIIAFQPRFSIYSATISYDVLLILMFALFTFGCVLALKNGPNWKNIPLIMASIYLGIRAKPTAYILVIGAALLFAYFAYEKVKNKSKNIKYVTGLLIASAAVIILIYFKNHFVGSVNSFAIFATSINNYLHESLTAGRFALSSRTYWGSLGWVDNWFLGNATDIIWGIEAFAVAGIVFFFVSKRPEHLPERKYIVFLVVMIILLQFGIRAADWTIFRNLGSLELGTPGRYFLPNLTTHIILVFIGIGALLQKKIYFERLLIMGLIIMMTFMMYIIFDTMIFRFYM